MSSQNQKWDGSIRTAWCSVRLGLKALVLASVALLAPACHATGAEDLSIESAALADNDASLAAEPELPSITPVLESYVDSDRVAGMATLVAHKGRIVHFQAIGERDIAEGEAMTTDTIFRLYSMTKPITSIAAMILVERGEISLDDPIEEYLPAFADPKVFAGVADDGTITTRPAMGSITVRDLLIHTSGLTYGVEGNAAVNKLYGELRLTELAVPLSELSDRVAEIPLVAEPGTDYNYSLSTAVLGRVIEVVSGESLDVFIAKNITQPLGMNDTGFFVPKEKLDRFSDLYTHDKSGDFVLYDDNQTGALSGQLPKLLLGDGGMVSTLSDYYRFCQMILNKGELDGVRILDSETVELLSKNHLPESSPHINFGPTLPLPGVGFGYGFAVSDDPAPQLLAMGATAPGELWWGGYSTTLFWIDPKEEVVGILMAQQIPAPGDAGVRFELRLKFRQAVYKALEGDAGN